MGERGGSVFRRAPQLDFAGSAADGVPAVSADGKSDDDGFDAVAGADAGGFSAGMADHDRAVRRGLAAGAIGAPVASDRVADGRAAVYGGNAGCVWTDIAVAGGGGSVLPYVVHGDGK